VPHPRVMRNAGDVSFDDPRGRQLRVSTARGRSMLRT